MSADKTVDIELAEPKITIDDVKRRAAAVRDLAKSEARRSADELLHERATRTALVGVAIVATIAGLAFFLGSRKGESKAMADLVADLPPWCCPPRS